MLERFYDTHATTTGWWLTYPSEKWWSESQLGLLWIIIPNIWKNVPNHQPDDRFSSELLPPKLDWTRNASKKTWKNILRNSISVDLCWAYISVLQNPFPPRCVSSHRSASDSAPGIPGVARDDLDINFNQWEIFRIHFMELRKCTICLALFCRDIP